LVPHHQLVEIRTHPKMLEPIQELGQNAIDENLDENMNER
jgi:hypothetical protein